MFGQEVDAVEVDDSMLGGKEGAAPTACAASLEGIDIAEMDLAVSAVVTQWGALDDDVGLWKSEYLDNVRGDLLLAM